MLSSFVSRHISPTETEIKEMLGSLGADSLENLIERTVPGAIRLKTPLNFAGSRPLPEGIEERAVLAELKKILEQNQVKRSLIGLGYVGTLTPPVILRNILENPGWYTQYTPYQAEISQGRLEALLNFQTLISELTGLDIANASLLDEGTAAAEAMILAFRQPSADSRNTFLVDSDCHPQTIACVKTRAWPLGIEVVVKKVEPADLTLSVFGVLLQYPTTDGKIENYSTITHAAHEAKALSIVAADLLSLTLLPPPGEWGADICVGNSQRFGVPFGFGGPHAAFFAVKDALKRQMPGRLIGVSKDRFGRKGLRLSLQTREQHIRRDKATSNICTAQVLLAVMASMYAVYHGPKGLRQIAERIHSRARFFYESLKSSGSNFASDSFFDTVRIFPPAAKLEQLSKQLALSHYNLRDYADGSFGINFDELSTEEEVLELIQIFGGTPTKTNSGSTLTLRTSEYLTQAAFNSYHSEHELLRYIHRLQSKDLSLTTSMIPLGSCTMKLNATVEMLPVTWSETGDVHPFAPDNQTRGYQELAASLSSMLGEITGLPGVSLQPNSGSQGEYAGLLAIKAFHEARGEGERNICLIPESAHGTNPASAAMAGFKVIPTKCDEFGNVDLADFKEKAAANAKHLAAAMITYPSTHGVFEGSIVKLCEITHQSGGQVYMDGANMNAQVGLCRPGDFGIDVCHLNLHKTFCIPHGGGGPGVGPICVKEHLAPFLPGHPTGELGGVKVGGTKAIGPISAAPYGSASILVIPWVYIRLMGSAGLKRATQVAILNANYISKRLEPHYPTLYRGENGFVAHECILDCREFKRTAGVEVEDIAKRLMDYGFHAPTVSFPVAGTLMVEPTESESKAELDRFCDAMISIREEIRKIESGEASKEDNPLKMAPHTAEEVSATEWSHPYSREEAAYPVPRLRESKFWPVVARIDSVYGDRNLFCACS